MKELLGRMGIRKCRGTILFAGLRAIITSSSYLVLCVNFGV